MLVYCHPELSAPYAPCALALCLQVQLADVLEVREALVQSAASSTAAHAPAALGSKVSHVAEREASHQV